MFRSTDRGERKSPLSILAFFVRILVLVILVGLGLLVLLEKATTGNPLNFLGAKNPRVGLIAGHWQNDSGAVCPDGLEEVELNLQIARAVAQIMRRQGYQVEVLAEFSPKLNDYRAAVLLAIHCDSCLEDLSGFKIARMTHSAVPEEEDRLVSTLYKTYSEATGLQPHYNTITDDMREYHALRQIADETPGAIIECGFMGGDRYILTEEQDRVAVGIANGLLAFLRETAEATPQQ
ncbi:MAG: N-acetylmuramoyl-L-alanine amidase [Chloroflexota bacterium]|nr:N-acetylmuramoyl-L-alanine amidase [Chloroflexota bacterium]